MKQSILGLSLFLIVFNSFALPINWYHTVPLIDIPAHISFGALIGLFVSLLIKEKAIHANPLGAILLGVIVIGFGWEVIEFLRDTYFALPRGVLPAQRSGLDTVWDMANNLIGGMLVYLLIFYLSAKREEKVTLSA